VDSLVRAGHSHIYLTPGNPVTMDLDTTRGAATAPLCFRCKKPGHFGCDCPTQFDVRSMTIDELQEALGLRLAERAVPAAESTTTITASWPKDSGSSTMKSTLTVSHGVSGTGSGWSLVLGS
jgi:hypothetical protein